MPCSGSSCFAKAEGEPYAVSPCTNPLADPPADNNAADLAIDPTVYSGALSVIGTTDT